MTTYTKKTAVISGAIVIFVIIAFMLGFAHSISPNENSNSFIGRDFNNLDYASNLKALDELLASLDKPLVVKTSSDFYRVGDEIFYCVDINESVPKDVADEISKRFSLQFKGYSPLAFGFRIEVNGKRAKFIEYSCFSPILSSADREVTDTGYILEVRTPFPIYGRIRASDVVYSLKLHNCNVIKEAVIPNLENTVEFKLKLSTGLLKNCSFESAPLTLEGLDEPGSDQCDRVKTKLNGTIFYDGEPYTECLKMILRGEEEGFLQEIDKLVTEGDSADDPFKRGYYLQTAEAYLNIWLRVHKKNVLKKREEVRKRIGL